MNYIAAMPAGRMESDQVRGGIAVGAIISILGVLAILFPFVTGLSLSMLLGALLVVGAIVHVGHAFSAGSFWGALWQVLLGILYGIAGISFMANPVVGLATLTILAIAFFFVDGIVEIGWAIAGRDNRGWIWLLGSGIISLLLAGMLWIGFPATAVWAVGVLFGVNVLVTGLSLIGLGMASRRAAREEAPAGERGREA
ncbi:HdeD family acid-resistance protein [Halomicrococcus sp. NG-SE-24]|uniref:HdeD family acid-resistance protein n=1 Tax=Halomicrococcus sp. NG-SE-24 TaxID=3436928 RepID=UPI003D973BB6